MWLKLISVGICMFSWIPHQANAQNEPSPPPVIASQTQSVTLKILQKGNGQPIRKVEIRVGDKKFFTDPAGEVKLEIPEGIVEIEFVRSGFATATMPISDLKSVSQAELFLEPAFGADDEVIVRGRRKPAISKKVISGEEAARVAPGGDPGQVTKLMPGVTTTPGRSEITIRGSKPADSAYYLDNIKVPFIYHTIGSLSVLPASMIEDVEFSAGGFGPEYGNATGGIVVLRSKNEIPEHPKTRFTLNIPFYSSIYHERPLSDSSAIFVGLRRSYLELILPKVLPKDSGVTVVPFFRDYQGIYLKKYDNGFDKFSLIASKDGLTATAPSGFSDDESGSVNFFVQTYFGAVALERQRTLDGGWTMNMTPQSVYTDNKFEVNDLRFRIRAQSFGIPIEFTNRISKDERLYVGADFNAVPYEVTYYLPRFDPDDPFYDPQEAPKEKGEERSTQYDFASWVARDIKLFQDGIITPGLRAFYFSPTKKSNADPRIQFRQGLGEGHVLKAAIGKYSQYPKNGEPTKSFGNPDLRFPYALHYILGIETKWDDRWDTDLQVFFKDVRDVIRSDPNTKYNNDGQLESYGVELFARRTLTERWFGWLSYTWSKTRERKDKSSDWYAGDNDQTHVMNLAGSYKVFPKWDVGGRFAYHTGTTYTSKLGDAVYNSNIGKYQPRSNHPTNSSRLPNYNELSLFSSHDGLFDEWKSTFRWGVEYFWFTRQAYDVRNNYDYSKEEYFKGVPPIPYIELRGEF